MKKWNIEFYDDIQGKCELKEYLDKLKLNHRKKLLAWISLLQDEGPLLPRPFADILEDGIHELRIKLSGDQIRILYFFVFENYIILTHSFAKNQKKVPKKEIKKAVAVKEEFQKRFSNITKYKKFLKENGDD